MNSCTILGLVSPKGAKCQWQGKYVSALLEMIAQLCASLFAALKTLGNTLNGWREDVARMFRYSRNNGITEGFRLSLDDLLRP